MFRYNKVKHINDLPNYEAYSVVLNGFFDGKKVHIFENISDCIDQSTLARECGLSTCHVDIRFIADKEHPCNRGNIKICDVCQFNDNCPYNEEVRTW